MSDHPVRATLAGILLFVIGLAIGGGAWENYRRERERLAAWQRADGQVVQVLHLASGNRPIVSFAAGAGERIRFTAMGRLAERTYQVGDHVPVLYPAVDPSAARIDSPALRWARTVYAGAGAVLLMVLGAYLAWYARKRDAERALQ